MKVIYGLKHFKTLRKKPVVALGVFDGFHRGHQRVIVNLLKEAGKLHTQSLIVTFFPHPQKQLALYSLPHRLKLLEEAGVDLCLVIRFSRAFRGIPAREFLQRILIKKINPAVVFIGRNFTFGRNAGGNWQMLRDCSCAGKFKLRVINVSVYKGTPVSSSHIRSLIKGGNFLRAQELLGRPITVFGRVTRGCRLGRILGYPTANVNPDHEVIPPFGVYAVRVRLSSGLFSGVCYIGSRPTVSSSTKTNIEVYIFGFKKNLYHHKIQIEFIRRIRPQKRFSSIQALTHRIKKDILACTRYSTYSPNIPQ